MPTSSPPYAACWPHVRPARASTCTPRAMHPNTLPPACRASQRSVARPGNTTVAEEELVATSYPGKHHPRRAHPCAAARQLAPLSPPHSLPLSRAAHDFDHIHLANVLPASLTSQPWLMPPSPSCRVYGASHSQHMMSPTSARWLAYPSRKMHPHLSPFADPASHHLKGWAGHVCLQRQAARRSV